MATDANPVHPTPANRGMLTVGDEVPEFGMIEAVSLTAYAFAGGGWVSFDRVHGKPAPVMPLVELR